MSNTKLDWKKFEPLFGTWAERIKPFFMEGGFDPIYAFLRGQTQAGRQIAPASMNTYRAFTECDFRELKCVVVCQDPYFKFINGGPIASGVAMDCSITARVQPTLQNFYNGIETELYNGLNLDYINTYDLSYLSKQGVLLLNVALTVEKDRPGSHIATWAPFMGYLFQEVIASTGVPVLLLGKEAATLKPLIEKTNHVYTLPHPASAAYTGGKWDTKGTFMEINDRIYESNKDTVLWLNIEPPF
jgi:uracil-DNA glycosylase